MYACMEIYKCKIFISDIHSTHARRKVLGVAETQTASKVLPSQKVKGTPVKIHIIKERCKQCNLCIVFCPRQVLQQSNEANKKGYHIPEQIEEPEKGKICLACGFCEVVCPDFAIWIEDRREKNEKDYSNR